MPASDAPHAPDTQPIRRVLVALDGSGTAEVVLPATFWLAERCGASVTLLHVIEHNAPETIHGEPHLDEIDEAHGYLQAVAERYAETGVPIEIHVHPNQEHDVARSIGEHAGELKADLIAMATHGSGGLRGFLFGRIAQQVLRHTWTPVLLVQPVEGSEPAPFSARTLLVPLDGTADGAAALPMAWMLAGATGTAVHLVRVVPTVNTVSRERGAAATFSPTATAALLDVEEEQAREELNALERQAPSGRRVTTEVRRGEPAAEIERAARSSGADLIVMSTHGRAGISGRLAGSIASRLLARVERPLLLIRVDGPPSD